MSLEPTERWAFFRGKTNQSHPEPSSGNDFMPKAPSKFLTPRDKGIVSSNIFRDSNNMNHLGGNSRAGFDARSPTKLQTPKRSVEYTPISAHTRGKHNAPNISGHLQYMCLNSSKEKPSPLKIRDKRISDFSILKNKDPPQSREPSKIFPSS
jgi:hypothetical protein